MLILAYKRLNLTYKVVTLERNKMEDALLARRKQELEIQIQLIENRLKGRTFSAMLDAFMKRIEETKANTYSVRELTDKQTQTLFQKKHELEDQLVIVENTLQMRNMAVTLKTIRSNTDPVIPITTTATATTTATTTTANTVPTNTTVKPSEEPTLKEMIGRKVSEHYIKTAKEEIIKNALEGQAWITIEKKHMQGYLLYFNQYCQKEQIEVIIHEELETSYKMKLRWF